MIRRILLSLRSFEHTKLDTVVVAFLDVAKAYDCADLRKLWPLLRKRGVSEGLIRTLQRLQVNCNLQIAYGGRLC